MYTSLRETFAKPVREHRLLKISKEDIQTWVAEVESVVRRWNDDSREHRTEGSGLDWSAIAQAAVDRNADRLAELRYLLQSYTQPSELNGGITADQVNATEAISRVRFVAFSLVMPYIDAPAALSSNATQYSRQTATAKALEKCTHAFTRYIPTELSVQETRLRDAVEGVLGRVCSFSLDVLTTSLEILEEGAPPNVKAATLGSWLKRTEDLMSWLAWPAWRRCERQCEWDVSFAHCYPNLCADDTSIAGALLRPHVAGDNREKK